MFKSIKPLLGARQIRKHPLSRGLVGHWLFNEGGGTKVKDIAGINNGILTNGPFWTGGKFGKAISFDGINDYINIPSGGGLNNLSTVTISLWVKWTSSSQNVSVCPNEYGVILARQKNGVFSDPRIGLDGTNPDTAKIFVNQAPSGCSADIISVTSPGINRFRHIVLVKTNGANKLYIDGVLDATGTFSGTYSNDITIPLSIGAWIDQGAGYSTSVIDDLRIYNYAFSAQEVKKLYINPFADVRSFKPLSSILLTIDIPFSVRAPYITGLKSSTGIDTIKF